MTITHCPLCGCEIFNGGRTKSHETYADCFAALDMEAESTYRRRKRVEKIAVDDLCEAKAESKKMHEVNNVVK